jgi:LPXTG-motif cell wall-anchored protein
MYAMHGWDAVTGEYTPDSATETSWLDSAAKALNVGAQAAALKERLSGKKPATPTTLVVTRPPDTGMSPMTIAMLAIGGILVVGVGGYFLMKK